MKHYLVYSYADKKYHMISGASRPEGEMEILYEFEQDELVLAKKILTILSIQNGQSLNKVA